MNARARPSTWRRGSSPGCSPCRTPPPAPPASPAPGVPIDRERAARLPPADPDGDLAALSGALCELLRQPGGARCWADTGAILARLRDTVLGAEPSDIVLIPDGDVPRLAAALAFNSLRDFLAVNHPLAFGRWGGAPLFHAAARLDGTGLGPYLTALPRLLGDSRDLFGLIGLASAQAGDSAPEAVPIRWLLRLSLHMPPAMRLDLIDDLGDGRRIDALAEMLAFVMARLPLFPDRAVLWRLRDAALDLGEMTLALVAQRSILALWPRLRGEWVVLGEMEATAGHPDSAEAAFAAALRLAPGDGAATKRLLALRTDAFDPFRVLGGFGSPSSAQGRAEHRSGLTTCSFPLTRSVAWRGRDMMPTCQVLIPEG